MASSAKETLKAANAKVAKDLSYMKSVLSVSIIDSKTDSCTVSAKTGGKNCSTKEK